MNKLLDTTIFTWRFNGWIIIFIISGFYKLSRIVQTKTVSKKSEKKHRGLSKYPSNGNNWLSIIPRLKNSCHVIQEISAYIRSTGCCARHKLTKYSDAWMYSSTYQIFATIHWNCDNLRFPQISHHSPISENNTCLSRKIIGLFD